MEPFTTYAKKNCFSISMSYYQGNTFDNKQSINFRFSLILIEKGSGILHINNNPVSFIAPCVLCINETEHILIPPSKDLEIKALYLHPCIINSSLDFISTRSLPENCPVTVIQDIEMLRFFVSRDSNYYGAIDIGPLSAKKISLLLSSINKETSEQSRDNWPCRSRSHLMEILFLLENIYSKDSFAKDPFLGQIDEEFYPVLLYIYNNYNQKITVSELTKEFNINRTSLSQLFQNNLGESLITFLNKLRVSIASRILRDTRLPIAEIMIQVGFNDSAHFLRTFKKYTGLSPSDYRDKFCWM